MDYTSIEKLHRQNVNDIINLNQSAASISAAYFETQSNRLMDIQKYVALQKMSEQELLDYVDQSNASADCCYELVREDYKGSGIWQDTEEVMEVDYTDADYMPMQKLFDKAKAEEQYGAIQFLPEFTDQCTGSKSVALCTYVRLYEGDGVVRNATLMVVLKTKAIQQFITLDGGFKQYATVIIDADGDYIVSHDTFKSANFYKYLYVFNDMTLDAKKELEFTVKEKKMGELYYRNSQKEDCVYVYKKLANRNWYSVSCVPLSSFQNSNNDVSYTALIAILLFFLLIFDMGIFSALNYQLKENVKKAQAANYAKTDFLSRMSHDIRTPLNVINGMTLLALQEKKKAVTDEYLMNIKSSSQFLTGLVNDILDLNKVEAGMMELHPVAYSYKEFARYIDAVIRPLCEEKEIAFTMRCNREDIVILIDSLRFNQIFFNLLSNAVKFTPEHGEIMLDCKCEKLASGSIAMQFLVSDTGKGMSKKFQEHMFEAFSQEDACLTGEIKGTGLGLAIVKQIVDLMKGEIVVDSAIDQGTTYTITFTVQQSHKDDENRLFAYDDSIFKNKRVLLCEDHPLNTKIAVKLLEKKQMIVETAENGEKGLRMFKEAPSGYYQLILMDIRMPVMDGIETAKAIRALATPQATAIPIIAMTANAYDMDVKISYEAGMNGHLAKPVEPKKLYDTMAGFLA